MKKKILLVLTAFVLLLTVGCKNGKQKEIVIELEGNPTTGYEWIIAENTNVDITEIKSEYIPDKHDDEVVGVGGVYKFTVKGLQEGEADVKFVYKRAWEENPDDKTVVYHFTVDSELNITEVHE